MAAMKYTIRLTETFYEWHQSLKDRQAKAAVTARLLRAASGNLGDHKSVGGGVSEMRLAIGQGYRLYYTMRGNTVIFMLTGGNKSSQQADIAKAQAMQKEIP